jgi:hypothetical protein
MKQSDLEDAIVREVENWPGVEVKFGRASKHPTAKFTFTPPEGGDPLMLSRPFAGTPSDAYFGVHQMLGDMRRAMKQLGATRAKPEPSKDEDEAPYRKPIGNPTTPADLVKSEPGPVKKDMGDKMVEAGAATAEQAEIARASIGDDGPLKREGRAILIDDEEDVDPADAVRMVELLAACGITIALDGQISLARVIVEAANGIVDGIYFGLPDSVYHAVPRLSASGLQRLCVSAGTFWKGSWLDPERPELDEDETKAQQLGKAYHVARLEPDRFHGSYVRQISASDYPKKGLITSLAGVKAALKEAGEQQSVTGESNEEKCERLVDSGYEGTILPLEKARWERTVNGRIPLAAKPFDQIVTDMENIRKSSEIADLLSNGAAEVSVFWTDQHGLKCKSRLDYLTAGHWSDLKTFDNSRGVPLEEAISNFIRYNRVHVQAVTYREAVEAIRQGGLQIIGKASDAQQAIVAAIQIRPNALACWYIFQEKGGVPNLLARQFAFDNMVTFGDVETPAMAEAAGRDGVRRDTALCTKAIWDIDRAKRLFVLYSEVYEPGQPWFPIEPRALIDDADFNSYWLESR